MTSRALPLVRALACWLWICVLWATHAQAAEPPTEPVLRIEVGMHTAFIRRVATDAQGRWAVTAADDKTARVWDMATGRLLQTLRPPIAGGHEGKLYAVALSPDGTTIALAGWTSWDWYQKTEIYLFERATGRLLHRLRDLPTAVVHLAWSPDGKFLAATLGGNHGLRVWSQPLTDAPPLIDDDYGEPDLNGGYGLAWSRSGKLATHSYDGQIRLYRVSAQALTKLKQMPTPHKKPYGLAFAPLTDELAVGYDDSPQVDVLDGETLALRYSPDIRGVGNGDLNSVAWSADGQYLVAAGRWETSSGRKPVRRWPNAGRGQPHDVPTTYRVVSSMVPLPDGRILVAAADPAWGLYRPQASDETAWIQRGQAWIADFEGSRADNGFAVSPDGLTVQFGYARDVKAPHRFDLGHRALMPGKDPLLPLPRTQGLDVQNWSDHAHPVLAGQPLALDADELSRSVAVAPDNTSLVLGADWSLRRYSAQGQELWRYPAPDAVFGVHIAPDAQRVVAAYGDGTIRWHRLSDGKELLAFFPHADRKRWVLWTPSGYYDASPGGEDLIGWHLNRGLGAAADFYPASQFRNRFFRPDVIDRILQTGDEDLALTQADVARGRMTERSPITQILPPVVEVLSGTELRSHDGQVTVRVRGRTAPDAPVTRWQVRVNGKPMPEARGVDSGAPPAAERTDEREFTIPIPAQDSDVLIFATNRHATSTPALVRVQWAGAAPSAEATFQIRPKLYVLAVGVAKYPNAGIGQLTYTAKDAHDFVDAIQPQKGRLYREVVVKLLTEEQATADAVVDGLEWLQKQVTQHDVGMVFVAGHGVNDPVQGYTFLPWNADLQRLRRTGVGMDEFKKTLSNLAGKAVFFLDTCHAGSVLGTSASRDPLNELTPVINELARAENGVIVFSSSTGRQFSYEDPQWANGAFTKAVVEGLSGQASYRDSGRITHKMLDVYVSERVKTLTDGKQSPVTLAPGGVPDFPLALTHE